MQPTHLAQDFSVFNCAHSAGMVWVDGGGASLLTLGHHDHTKMVASICPGLLALPACY